ncbi:MAG: LptE family protein [Rikenellaceae bacterium]
MVKLFNSNLRKAVAGLLLCCLSACTFSYSFTGASIPVEAKTFSVEQIQNIATMVAPILASTFTDELKLRMSQQTRLSQVNEGGDLAFSGEVINYTSTPTAVTGDEYASMNRLTITAKIRFTNKYDQATDFEKTFSAYQDYDSSQLLQTVETTLITELVEQLVDDIFNAAVSNW